MDIERGNVHMDMINTADQVVFEEIEERKKATIRTIDSLYPIPNADLIELATVDGWHCVVKKGEFEVGQSIVYIEADSILPPEPQFEFMAKTNYRVKTIRLRGQVSQGLVFPMTILGGGSYPIGEDVSQVLGVKKYLPPVRQSNNYGSPKGNFPGFLRKTDEENLQNMKWVIGLMTGTEWVATEKLDGSSMTIYRKDGVFGVCSRNLELKMDMPGMFTKFCIDHNLEKRMVDAGLDNLAIQGELIGPGIQGNKYNLTSMEFRPFQVYDIKRGVYLDYIDFRNIVDRLDLITVPLLARPGGEEWTVDRLVSLATFKSILNPKVWAEGLVFRPMVEGRDNKGNRISFKVKNPEFLLKEG